jgi:hypothetical protein
METRKQDINNHKAAIEYQNTKQNQELMKQDYDTKYGQNVMEGQM